MKVLIKILVCFFNRVFGRFEPVFFLLGDGRSGTTWVMEVLNFDKKLRVLFEPFNAIYGMRVDKEHLYPLPDKPGETLIADQVQRVFRGAYMNRRISATIPRICFDGLLIKDISSQMILDPILEKRQGVKKLMILRHPFAVSLSKSKLIPWLDSVEWYLSDSNPHRASLAPYVDLIKPRNGRTLDLVVKWCVVHKIAFESKAIKTFRFIFYEDLVYNPEENFRKVFEGFGRLDQFEENREAIMKVINRKSNTTSDDNSIGESQIGTSKWMKEWSPETIKEALKILELFGLDFLYGPCHFPKITPEEVQDKIRGLNI